MKRFIEQQLLEWKNDRRRKPLLVRGPRQVGKTFSVKEFGRRHFSELAYLDLERDPRWHKIFSENLDARRICSEIEVILNLRIVPGNTLLFIDEIQACPRAITALRYFHEEMPELHIVAAGSLLEFAMSEISFPVGRLQFLRLYPLSFAEYLQAIGREEAAEAVQGRPRLISTAVHDLLLEEVRRYFFVGGMPESVRAYVETGSLVKSFRVQGEIVEAYRLDFAKYAPRSDKLCLNAVLSGIAALAGEQIKYSRLAEGYSNPTLKKAFELLVLAGLAKRIPAVSPRGLPLAAGANAKIFKALPVDIGLLRYLSGLPASVEYSKSGLLDIFRGKLAVQFVGQELAIAQQGKLYYWARQAKSSSAEVDYVVVKDNRIFPVEVKSGSAGRLKSLHLFLRKYPDSPGGLVFSARPYAELSEQKITFLPLYFALSATRLETLLQ